MLLGLAAFLGVTVDVLISRIDSERESRRKSGNPAA